MNNALPTLLMLAAAGTALAAAEARLEISGSVADPSGASVLAATVRLRGADGSDPRSTFTTDTGRFRFTGLAGGAYEIRAEHEGFKPAVVKLRLGTKSPAPLRIVLSIADIRQEMTVEGGAGRPSAEAAENLDTVRLDRKTLDGLPILGNDIVGAVSDFLDSSALGTGGASMVVDGLETSEKGVTASAIQEVRINQNPYSAEYSRPGRGRIEVITKPGGSEYHGALNFLFRDSFLDARNAFAETRPSEQRRIFEGNFTGPVGKGGKTSFVVSGNHEEEDLQSLVFARTPAGEVRANFPQPQRQTELNGRLTRQIGKRQTVAVRYEFQDESALGSGVGGFALPETAADFSERQHHIYFNHRLTIGTRLVNEFSLRGGSHNAIATSRLRGVAAIVVQDAFTGGGAQADQHSTENHVQFTDMALWTRGRHLLKFGVNVPDLSRRGSNDRTNTDGTFTFSSLDDYARGTPFSYVVQRGDGHLALWQKELGLFLQDDFKLRKNLSLALGLRYDWQNYLTDHNNLAPRLSLAWSPDRKHKTVLRAGTGIFYNRTGAGAIADMLRFDGRHLLRMVLENPGYPVPSAPLAVEAPSLVRFASGLRTPYLAQYSFGVERQLQSKLTLTAGYTGIVGVKMFGSRDVNAPPPPLYASRPDPTVGVLREIESAGRLASRSLELGLRGSMTRYFKGTVLYTAGSAWNNTNGINSLPASNYDLSGEWAHASFDTRHRLNLMGAFRPDKLFNLGVKFGWNTGSPYNLTTGRDDNRDGRAADRPAGVPRNSLRAPGAANLDLRWSREFALGGGKKKDEGPGIAVAIDAFNALNRVNYSSFVGNLSSPFFGQPVAARPARRMQVSLEFKF